MKNHSTAEGDQINSKLQHMHHYYSCTNSA